MRKLSNPGRFVSSGPYGHGAVAEDFVTKFGLQDLRFSATTPMGGASAVASIQCALAVIQAGICKHVLLSLGRTGYSGGRIGYSGGRIGTGCSRCRSSG